VISGVEKCSIVAIKIQRLREGITLWCLVREDERGRQRQDDTEYSNVLHFLSRVAQTLGQNHESSGWAHGLLISITSYLLVSANATISTTLDPLSLLRSYWYGPTGLGLC